jgi:hypothetical protein
MNYTTQKINLEREFTRELNVAKQIYAESTIQRDGRIDQQLEDVRGILGQMERLQTDIADDIETNTQTIQSIVQTNTITVPQVNQNPSFTAKQMMQDAQSLYDQHRILLFLKVCIVLLILVKGNDVYADYKLIFVGGSLACIFVYFMFMVFYR